MFDSAIETVEQFEKPGERINTWHVAFLPRASWIFGAALYRMVGFVEVADALGVLTFTLAFRSRISRSSRRCGGPGTDPRTLADVPKLNHTVSGNDSTIIASRNRRTVEFFRFSFLPRQFVRLPVYFYDVAVLRWHQLVRAWLAPIGK